jgi:integrase
MSGIYKWYASDYEIVPPSGLFSTKHIPRGWNVKRNRRLSQSEYQLIVDALRDGRNKDAQHLKLLIDLALETGARMNEMISAELHEFDLDNFLWRIPEDHTKSKTSRNVPLSDAACLIIEQLNQLRPPTSSRLFSCFKSSVIVSMRFFSLFKRLKINDLRFHDLRHEAISRMVLHCRNLSVYEIMEIVGHKSIDMLQRYANLRPEEMIARFRIR